MLWSILYRVVSYAAYLYMSSVIRYTTYNLFRESTHQTEQNKDDRKIIVYSSPNRFRPDPTRPFVANHASPHGLLWCASFHEHGALAGLDFPDDNEVALATQKNILPLFNFDVVF
jgi:hypothetical protein